MAVEFRCESCEKLLSVDAPAGTALRCPHCKAKLVVPAGLAALPTPKLAGQQTAGQQQAQQEEEESQEESKGVAVLANSMPWVISAFLHGGVFLLTMFIIFIADAVTQPPIAVPVPDAEMSETPGGSVSPGGGGDPNRNPSSPTPVKNSTGKATREGKVSASPGAEGGLDLIGVGAGGSAGGGGGGGAVAGEFEIGGGGGSGAGPKSSFYGSGGNCNQVIYVIDRSGSMMETFDALKAEMIRSISSLRDSQEFHVIFYAAGKPMEMEPSGLKPATREYKLKAVEFIKGISVEGNTNPALAMERALGILAASRKPNKIIYLLTDAKFDDPPSVINTIKQKNVGAAKSFINTFLYGAKPGEDAEKIMQDIANESGGRYKWVEAD